MPFVKIPNLPQNKVDLMLIDENINNEICDSLINFKINLIKIKSCSALQEGVSSHPDILMFYGGGGDIVVAPNVIEEYAELLLSKGFNVIKGNTYLKNQYPYDIAYNAAVIGKYVICNLKYADEQVLTLCKSNGFEFINVKQGYAKCSVCIVSNNAIITSDEGIYDAVKKYDIDALLIIKGNIELKGYNSGFIGGSSGKIDSNTICFTGNIENHLDYKNIKEFCDKHKCKVISLYSKDLYDYGSLIPLCEV